MAGSRRPTGTSFGRWRYGDSKAWFDRLTTNGFRSVRTDQTHDDRAANQRQAYRGRHAHCFSHAPRTMFGYSGLPRLPL